MVTDGKWLNDSDTLTLIPPSREAIASKKTPDAHIPDPL